MNPYRSTAHVARPSDTTFRWKRVIAYALLIYVVANIVGFLSGLTMGRWQIYGDTIEQAIDNARLVRRIVIWTAAAALYWLLATGVVAKRALHVLATFGLLFTANIAIEFLVFRAETEELFDLWATLRNATAALAGLCLANIGNKTRRVG